MSPAVVTLDKTDLEERVGMLPLALQLDVDRGLSVALGP